MKFQIRIVPAPLPKAGPVVIFVDSGSGVSGFIIVPLPGIVKWNVYIFDKFGGLHKPDFWTKKTMIFFFRLFVNIVFSTMDIIFLGLHLLCPEILV